MAESHGAAEVALPGALSADTAPERARWSRESARPVGSHRAGDVVPPGGPRGVAAMSDSDKGRGK
eukprot:7869826-Alexandrium_andersonii.AAC.1